MNKRHIWIMLLCCLLPLVGLAAIFLSNVPVNSVIYFGLLALCPLTHFLMMRQHGGSHEEARDNHIHVENIDKK
jgi:uncharacterized MnhB-related membrane protein